MLGMPNPRSLKDQQGESETNHGLISFAVIYPCTSDAHESEIIPHDLTLLRKSPDVIITAMFNSLYGRPHTVRTTVGRPDYLTIQPPVSASGFYFDLDSTWNLIVFQGCVIHGMISLIITFDLEHIVRH